MSAFETMEQLRMEALRLLVEDPDLGVPMADREDQLMALSASIMVSAEEYLRCPAIMVPCLRMVVERVYRLGYRDGEASERAKEMCS